MPPRSTKNSRGKVGRWPSAGRGAVTPAVRRALRFVAGLLMLPVSMTLVRTLIAAEKQVGERAVLDLSPATGMFSAGFVLFALVYVAVVFPARPYVFGHELTHALFGLVSGAKVRRLRVKEENGSVRVSGGGLLVLLAPYFFPIYMVALLLVFGLVSLVVPLVDSMAGRIVAGLTGAAWGFHFCFTVNAMLQRQSDLEAYGFFFSFSLILLLNLLVLAFVFVAISPFTFSQMSVLGREKGVDTLLWFWDAWWNARMP